MQKRRGIYIQWNTSVAGTGRKREIWIAIILISHASFMFLEAVNELNEESPGCPPLSLSRVLCWALVIVPDCDEFWSSIICCWRLFFTGKKWTTSNIAEILLQNSWNFIRFKDESLHRVATRTRICRSWTLDFYLDKLRKCAKFKVCSTFVPRFVFREVLHLPFPAVLCRPSYDERWVKHQSFAVCTVRNWNEINCTIESTQFSALVARVE